MLLYAIIVKQKWTFQSSFQMFSSGKMTLCNNNYQTWFSDTLASARPLGVLTTLAFQAWVQHHHLGSSRCKCIEKHPYSGLQIFRKRYDVYNTTAYIMTK